jgi:hypothetical protein
LTDINIDENSPSEAQESASHMDFSILMHPLAWIPSQTATWLVLYSHKISNRGWLCGVLEATQQQSQSSRKFSDGARFGERGSIVDKHYNEPKLKEICCLTEQ